MCARQDQSDDEAYIVHREAHAFAILNAFPYNTGHVMVVPTRHVADLLELSDEEQEATQRLVRATVRALRTAFNPDGVNVGLNLGDAAGAGIAAHLHWHIVPRWKGDTNFTPVIADSKVMNFHLADTWRQVRDAFPKET
jgi:ATP adenylyltransferase